MKLVNWKFNELEVPMIEVNGELYCTSKAICSALNINEDTLKKCYQRNLHDIGKSLEVQNVPLMEFLKQNKEHLEIKRVRADLHLWSEKQMFLFTVFISSPASTQFREDLWNFVKQNVQTSTVTLEMYQILEARNESLEARLAMQDHRLSVMESTMKAVQTPMEEIATASGKLLQMQKGLKPFRTDKEIKAV